MTNKEAVSVLHIMKRFYTDTELDKNFRFDSMESEAIDIAIKELKQNSERGYTHQKVERDVLKELMTDPDKCRLFVQLQKSIHNFIFIMGDIDIQIDIQTKKGSDE